jgi:hypothetical protein
MENKCYAINLKTNEVKAYVNKKVAQGMGNGVALFTNIDELAENVNMSGDRLVSTYNKIADKPVKKFSDKKTGVARLFKLVVDTPITPTYWDSGEYNPKLGSVKTSKDEMELYKEKVPTTGRKGVKKVSEPKLRGKFAGKSITVIEKENPRREGTRAWHNYNLFLEHDPLPYEKFVELADCSSGACREDLDHDIKKGRVKLV